MTDKASAARPASPGHVQGNVGTTGAALRLFTFGSGSETFPANTPFYIRHGFFFALPDAAAEFNPDWKFVVWVDGVEQPSLLDIFVFQTQPTLIMGKTFLTNFPAGMTGTHTFTDASYEDGILTGSGATVVTFTWSSTSSACAYASRQRQERAPGPCPRSRPLPNRGRADQSA